MLDWEKVNAIEHLRKDSIAKQEKLDNRVITIEDRCVCGVHVCVGGLWKQEDIAPATARYAALISHCPDEAPNQL